MMGKPKINPALGIPTLRDDKHDLHDLEVGTYRGPQAVRKTDWACVGEALLNVALGVGITIFAMAFLAAYLWGML